MPVISENESFFSSQHFIISDHNSSSSTYFEQSNDGFDEINNSSTFSSLTYQYNLHTDDKFDDWSSVDTFIHNYCRERSFGYQIFRNDKDSNDPTITC